MFQEYGVLNYYDHMNLERTGKQVVGPVQGQMEVLTDQVSGMTGDMQTAMENANEQMRDAISDVIASQERIAAQRQEMFFELTNMLGSIQDSIIGGFTDMLSVLDDMNDSLEQLLEIARTPNETAAMEHFVHARDNFDKSLYPEAMKRIDFAIFGDGRRCSGHPEEWRFHYLRGLLFSDPLAGYNDSKQAEACFLTAARYAKADDYTEDAGMHMLSASWMSYVQKDFIRSAQQCSEALQLIPGFAEALYHQAKLQIEMEKVPDALQSLEALVNVSPKHFLKVAADSVFAAKSLELTPFFVKLRDEKKRVLRKIVSEDLTEAELWLSRGVENDAKLQYVIFLRNFLECTPNDLVTLFEQEGDVVFYVVELSKDNTCWKRAWEILKIFEEKIPNFTRQQKEGLFLEFYGWSDLPGMVHRFCEAMVNCGIKEIALRAEKIRDTDWCTQEMQRLISDREKRLEQKRKEQERQKKEANFGIFAWYYNSFSKKNHIVGDIIYSYNSWFFWLLFFDMFLWALSLVALWFYLPFVSVGWRIGAYLTGFAWVLFNAILWTIFLFSFVVVRKTEVALFRIGGVVQKWPGLGESIFWKAPGVGVIIISVAPVDYIFPSIEVEVSSGKKLWFDQVHVTSTVCKQRAYLQMEIGDEDPVKFAQKRIALKLHDAIQKWIADNIRENDGQKNEDYRQIQLCREEVKLAMEQAAAAELRSYGFDIRVISPGNMRLSPK